MKKSTVSVQCPGCGKQRVLRIWDWRKRKSDYCLACKNRVTVGLEPDNAPSAKGTPLHNAWRGMRQRCGHLQGGHAIDLKHYQKRGITVCDDWLRSFKPFYEWAMANGYKPGLILDRRDNNRGYSPDNCRWVTITESNRNKRTTLRMEDVKRIRKEARLGTKQRKLARLYNVSEATISNIVNRHIWL